MNTHEIVIAGFGGQGLLFSGKVLAYAGLLENRELSWLPSYGPEMRGGTANCNVILSDTPVGSPIVQNPNVLMVMNAPSLDKYESTVAPSGVIFVDSALITRKVERTDVKVCYIPATGLASEKGLDGLANMIIMGKLLADAGQLGGDSLEKALKKCISARHADLLKSNYDAMMLGSTQG